MDRRKTPQIVIEGMEKIIKRDLEKHKAILLKLPLDLQALEVARGHEVEKKRHYRSLIGGGKYNDEALKESIKQIKINIRQNSDKIKLTKDAIEHHTLIVNTLSEQLEKQEQSLKDLADYRREQLHAINN
jgi:hypothetical protein